jgi:aspartyl aminopeptidase
MATSQDDRHPQAEVRQMLADLEASPTPYHAVARTIELLTAAGFAEVDLDAPLPADGRHFVASGGLLIAWASPGDRSVGAAPPGFVIVGAHTDSPNLRVRTHPDSTSAGWEQVGVEVYGGILANSWLDRDLGVAGRVLIGGGDHAEVRLVRDQRPVLRIPQLAIHLDREIRENGLLVDPQKHLVPLWAIGSGEPGTFRSYVADLAGVASDDIVSWDLMAYDTQAPGVVGRDDDLIASARIDNLFSTFCGVHGLIAVAADPGLRTPVLVLYDHEEVGSHATHPNYVDKHEPNHLICGERRCGRETERQPALRLRRRQRGAVPGGLRCRRRAGPDLHPSQRSAVRIDDRAHHRRPSRGADRRRRGTPARHAQRPRERRDGRHRPPQACAERRVEDGLSRMW